MGKSWAEKLNDPRPHQVKPAPVDIAGMRKGETMLVPTPAQVDAVIRAIPEGTAIDVPALRRRLAQQHGAQVTCPVTTGFHLRTVAEAAWEAHCQGTPMDAITPFWRVLDARAPTTAKLSFGATVIRDRRRSEGLPD